MSHAEGKVPARKRPKSEELNDPMVRRSHIPGHAEERTMPVRLRT